MPRRSTGAESLLEDSDTAGGFGAWGCGGGLLGGVAGVVEFEEAGEDFAARGVGDGEAAALLGVVEAVAEVEVLPIVRGGDGGVEFDVEVAEGLDRAVGVGRIVGSGRGDHRSWRKVTHSRSAHSSSTDCSASVRS